MDWFQSLILGILQGLTEFLPVSSSGHIELGKAILGANTEQGMMFTVVVHGATVLSTVVVFWKDILKLFGGLFKFKWNQETQYISLLLLSMIPTVIVGLLFEEQIEALFTGNILFVGLMLLVTASLLAFTFYAITKLLGVMESITVHKFIDDLNKDVDKMWRAPKGSQPKTYNVPSGVDFVCFADVESHQGKGEKQDYFLEISRAKISNENTFFYSPSLATYRYKPPLPLAVHFQKLSSAFLTF